MPFDPTRAIPVPIDETPSKFDPSRAIPVPIDETPVKPPAPVTPSEPGVGKPTKALEGLNDIPILGDLVRRGLDFPQTIRNLGSKALWSGAAESLPGVKTGYEPPTQAEKNVKTGGNVAGSIAQAAGGAGLGSLAAKGLKAPKAIETLLQLSGAATPGTVKAGVEGGPAAATKQGLLEMLVGGAGLGAIKGLKAAATPAARAVKSEFLGLMEKLAEQSDQLPYTKINDARIAAALSRTPEGRALVKAVGPDQAQTLLLTGNEGMLPNKIGSKEIVKGFDIGGTPYTKQMVEGVSLPLPNLIRDAETAATAAPGKMVGSFGRLESAKKEAEQAIAAVADKGFKYSDVNDMRRAYTMMAHGESDPTIKTFYQSMADGIGKRAVEGPLGLEGGKMTPKLMEGFFGDAIKAEPAYMTQMATEKARAEALKKQLIKWGITAGAGTIGLGALGKFGIEPITKAISGK
jgi:hypothetical protein